MENVEIAIEVEVDGIFLINHQVLHPELFKIGRTIKETFPGIWMGINCLDLTPHEIFSKIPDVIDGIWVDNAGIRENKSEQKYAEQKLELQRRIGWKGLYFVAVAFKYQKPVKDLERTAKIASNYMDVVTTSGPGTGMTPETQKIRKMADAIDSNENAVLGIASGITPENVEKYHYASFFFWQLLGYPMTLII